MRVSWGEPTGVSLISALAACSDGARGINACVDTPVSLGTFEEYHLVLYVPRDLGFRQLRFAASRVAVEHLQATLETTERKRLKTPIAAKNFNKRLDTSCSVPRGYPSKNRSKRTIAVKPLLVRRHGPLVRSILVEQEVS